MTRTFAIAIAICLVSGGCVDLLKHSAASDLRCPMSQVEVTADLSTARAEGCGRLVLYDRVCDQSTVVEPGKFVQSPGSFKQECGYEGFGSKQRYRCKSVWVAGTTTYEKGGTSSETTCRWVARSPRWRADDVAESIPTPPNEERGWERHYRPPAPSSPAAATASPPTSPSAAVPEEAPLPTQVTIADLGDVADAEATLRSWVGQPVRLALANGDGFEGVLKYVRTFTLWFSDGSQHRLEDILAAERFELPP